MHRNHPPPMSSSEVKLRWSGQNLVFTGGVEGGPQVTLDADGVAGPSPPNLLLLSLAGCMGIDLRTILEKSRVPVEMLEVEISADRVEDHPRRFSAVRLTYLVRGPGEEHQDKVDRAIGLSRDKYCSVLHTLRPDLALDIDVRRV